jgi:hypothetical protein
MAIDFPSSPTAGSTYTYQGINYTWIDTSGMGGADGFWKVNTPGSVGVATGAEVDTGTDNAKYVTPLAMEDSSYSKSLATTTELGLVEMATTAEAQTGISDLVTPSVEKAREMIKTFAKGDVIRYIGGESGTYTIPDGLQSIKVTTIAGGAAGGAASGAGTGASSGGGGGAGAFAITHWLASELPSSVSFAVGLGSTSTSLSSNPGNGGGTTFYDVSLNGGVGGATDASRSTTVGRGEDGGVGGTVATQTSTGTIIVSTTGGRGTIGAVYNSTSVGGDGAGTYFGGGGAGSANGGSGGLAYNHGAGGGGAAEWTSTGRFGGIGGEGIIIIEEFYN